MFNRIKHIFYYLFTDTDTYFQRNKNEFIKDLEKMNINVEINYEDNDSIEVQTLNKYVLFYYYPKTKELELMFDIRTNPEFVAFVVEKIRRIKKSVHSANVRQSFYPKRTVSSNNEEVIKVYRGNEAHKTFIEDVGNIALNSNLERYIEEIDVLYHFTASENVH